MSEELQRWVEKLESDIARHKAEGNMRQVKRRQLKLEAYKRYLAQNLSSHQMGAELDRLETKQDEEMKKQGEVSDETDCAHGALWMLLLHTPIEGEL